MMPHRDFCGSSLRAAMLGTQFRAGREGPAVKAGRNGWRFGIALAAALFLVLQSVAGALAPRPSASPVLDIFGNVLCLAGSAASDSGDHRHQKAPPCCLAGCGSSGLSWAPLAHAGAVLDGMRPHRSVAIVTAPAHIVAARPRTPANPRAPPAIA